MAGVEHGELEVFITLSEELHFGRTARRLYLSQGRVSQLLRTLEDRIGAKLFERSSRRVALTQLGAEFLREAKPAHERLCAAFETARSRARGLDGVLRIGFIGGADSGLLTAVPRFQRRYPGCELELRETRLSDPFGPLHRGEIDLVFACLPVDDPALAVGPVMSSVPVVLGVSARHAFADRERIGAEELVDTRMIDIDGPAPRDWKAGSSPQVTPNGRPIPRGPLACTQQEALSQIATDRGVMVFCRNIVDFNGRADIRFVPVDGLPASRYAPVWHRDRDNARVRAFVELIGEHGLKRPTSRVSGLAA